jgi:hypothetical protein
MILGWEHMRWDYSAFADSGRIAKMKEWRGDQKILVKRETGYPLPFVRPRLIHQCPRYNSGHRVHQYYSVFADEHRQG